MVTFPLWFKLYIGWFVVTMIFALVSYIGRDKYILKLRELPTEKKARILKSYSLRIKIYKLLLWASPIYLILQPFLIYKYSKSSFFHMTIMTILMYICVLEDFVSKSFLFKKLTRTP